MRILIDQSNQARYLAIDERELYVNGVSKEDFNMSVSEYIAKIIQTHDYVEIKMSDSTYFINTSKIIMLDSIRNNETFYTPKMIRKQKINY